MCKLKGCVCTCVCFTVTIDLLTGGRTALTCWLLWKMFVKSPWTPWHELDFCCGLFCCLVLVLCVFRVALPLTHLQLFLIISTNTSSLFFCLHAAGLFSSPRCRTWSPGSRSFLTAASCVLVIATRLALFPFDLSSDQTTSSSAPLPPSLPAPRPPALALQRSPLCFTPSNSFRPEQFKKCLLTRLPVLVSVFI